jgi:regulator of protease activity HflC (stomatin/prohibitin superfamily)
MIAYLAVAAPIAVFPLLLALSGLRVAQEYQRAVIFRLGRCVGTRGPGLYWLIPLLERGRTLDMRTNTVAVEAQDTITKDSVTVRINAVVWFRVTDPVQAVIAVADYEGAVYQVALTSLRNLIGQFPLDDALRERDVLNARLRDMVAGATGAWGVEIQSVEMKDVEIPIAMQRAMAREAEAMREAATQLAQAAQIIATYPTALELRRMQMIADIGAEQHTTTILMMPSEFVTLAGAAAEALQALPKKDA